MPIHAFAHSVPSATSIGALVVSTYDLAPIIECRLLQRGFNDSYAVTIETGERFVLRLSISRHRLRAEPDVAVETAFLAYLDAVKVPVATAVPTREGALFTTARLPDGPRVVVLFRHAEGRPPAANAPADARAQGLTLAQLHVAADTYPGRKDGRHSLDLNHLLHWPVQAILALDLGASRARADLATLEMQLADAVGRLIPTLRAARCHGDVHGFNARIVESGSNAGKAVFFDFDEGGFGYLAYDLAVYLWAQVSFGRRNYDMWHAFDSGYRSIRPLDPPDETAIPVFAAIRHIWLIGEWAAGTPRFGVEYMPLPWLESQLAFLLDWERDQLGRRLL